MPFKFESPLSARYQQQGLLVQADSDDLVRFEVQHDGTGTKLFAATFLGGVPTTRIYKAISIGVPHYLRVTRIGDQWTLAYSSNGVNWTPGVSFAYALAMNTLGIYAGNAGGHVAHTTVADYIFNTASPITPEDGGTP